MSRHAKSLLDNEDEDFFFGSTGTMPDLVVIDPARADTGTDGHGRSAGNGAQAAAKVVKVDRSADFLLGASGGGNPTLTDPANSALAAQLTDGYWQFNGSVRRSFDVMAGGIITVDLGNLTQAGRQLAKWALDAWTDASGLRFKAVNNNADISFDDKGKFAFSTSKGAGDGTIDSSFVNVAQKWIDYYGHGKHTYAFQTYIHEIGHAIGLGHAGDYNGSANYSQDAEFTNDSWQASVMSYFSQKDNTDVKASVAFVMGPQVADVIAIRELYGTTAIRANDNSYSYRGDFEKFFSTRTIVDTGGTDKIDLSWSSRKQLINLNAEEFSNVDGVKGNLGIARGTVIEIAIGGSGQDRIIGNDAANAIFGGGGRDKLTGNGGEDFFVFDTKPSKQNVDTITDFVAGKDTIVLNNNIFAAIKTDGDLLGDAFAWTTTGVAVDEEDRLVYNSLTGELFYDRNGNVAGGSVLIARLSTGLSLTAGDFEII